MITLDLRHAIGRAVSDAGFGAGASGQGVSGLPDPGLRPGGEPGQYASSVAFGLATSVKNDPEFIAARLAACLEGGEAGGEPWIATAAVTGRGYVTVTITETALEKVADRVAAAGPACVRSGALVGSTYPQPARAEALAAATWEEARERLTAELTARLAEAAGATENGRVGEPGRDGPIRSGESSGERRRGPAAAVAFAGRDAVRFSLARLVPGQPADIDPEKIARHHPGNPAYAVRYAHARAASGVRWAAAADPDLAGPQRPPADPEELALLDALSWLPERVATAARRGRPDEFARYLEHVANVTLATLTRPRAPGQRPRRPGSDRLTLASAARTGLAAGLTLLGVSAPDRLLDKATGEDQRHEPCRSPRGPPVRGCAARRSPARAAGRPEHAGGGHLAAERDAGRRERRAHARGHGRA
ncbi:MAG TPA: DALR anticodon-binding domain-containing protein [Trebonia sp.]